MKSLLVDTLLSDEEVQFGRSICSCARTVFMRVLAPLSLNSLAKQPFNVQLNTLNELTFKVLQVKCSRQLDGTAFTVSGTLLKGAGNCLGVSSLYLALADYLGVPVRPLLFEGHMAVQYDDINSKYIETSRCGRILSGSRAKRRYHLCGTGKVLSTCELRAVHASNRSVFVSAAQGDYEEAIDLIRKALAIFPTYTAGWINLATLLLIVGHVAEARRALTACSRLKPSAVLQHRLIRLDQELSRGSISLST